MIGGTGLSAWLLDSFFAFTALLMLVLAVRRPVARWLGPQAAYLLWLIPAARWLVPPLALPDFMRPFAMRDSVPVAEPVASAAVAPVVFEPATTASSFDLASALTGVWIGGALLLLAALIFHHIRVVRRLGRDAALLGKVGSIRLMESSNAQGPLATGIWKRIVFVPQSARAWPADAHKMAVAHEVTHHRAGHLAHNFVAILLLCLNWFNPVAWIAARAFIFDQEADCDARTLGRYAFDRAAYARMLVAATTATCPTPGPLSLRANLINKSVIVRRIRRIAMTEKSTSHRVMGYGLVALAGVALMPLTASLAHADPALEAAAAAQPAARENSENRITIMDSNAQPTYRRDVTHKGKTYKIYADHDISEGEARKTIDDSEAATASAAVAIGEAGVTLQEANRTTADARRTVDEAHAAADVARAEAQQATSDAEQAVRDAQKALQSGSSVTEIVIDPQTIRRQVLSDVGNMRGAVEVIEIGNMRFVPANGQNAMTDEVRQALEQAKREGRATTIRVHRVEPGTK